MRFLRLTAAHRPGKRECLGALQKLLFANPGGVEIDGLVAFLEKSFTREMIQEAITELELQGKLEEIQVSEPLQGAEEGGAGGGTQG